MNAMNPWSAISGATVLLLVLVTCYKLGYDAGADRVQAAWDRAEVRHREATLASQKAYRAQEQQWAAKVQELSDDLHHQREELRATVDAVLAERDAGERRLRERFQGCERRLSETTDPAGGDDGGRGSGLSVTDERFLVRIAGQCDDVALRLTSCQAYVRNACLTSHKP